MRNGDKLRELVLKKDVAGPSRLCHEDCVCDVSGDVTQAHIVHLPASPTFHCVTPL
jgi:hypothetical protein